MPHQVTKTVGSEGRNRVYVFSNEAGATATVYQLPNGFYNIREEFNGKLVGVVAGGWKDTAFRKAAAFAKNYPA